ncbi:uncharacterized protein LOC117384385 [Periophthalmus magnuspinnatus]|uniref:uncharacterized protein LOC117384385 n=1 Tax=Periophthalmus magnuspinnatus TaxID=409849 RepID=UPI00145AD428|nr:uncharacterized protein LOC117384385 [Periophthalmus magnuspinnatus]
MQTQGSTSSQPSFDSFSSTDSLLFSDSEHAEDDSDVFLTDTSSSVIISGTAGAMPDGDRAVGSPVSQWTCDDFMDKEEEEEGYRSESTSKTSKISLEGESEPTGKNPKTQGDLMFAQKCAELQGFVRPLLELLNGLKKGRFDRGLSSFQQSVAMDRIQRIVGVLQRPNCGEKYLNTLLQVEVMLKLWFPQIATFPVSAASSVANSPALSLQDTAGFTPSHRHKDQSHIPVKKRRLSWTGTDSPTPSPVLLKSPRTEEDKSIQHRENHSPPAASETNQNSTDSAAENTEEQSKPSNYKGHSLEPSLTWVHIAPILSPRKSTSPKAAQSNNQSFAPPSSSRKRNSPATQDSSVSSTTTRKNQKSTTKTAWCQSQPSAAQMNDNENDPSRSMSRHCPESVLSP